MTQESKHQSYSLSIDDIISEIDHTNMSSISWKEYAVKAHDLGLSIQAISTQLNKLGLFHDDDDLIQLEPAHNIAAEEGFRKDNNNNNNNNDNNIDTAAPESISKEMMSWGFDITNPAMIRLVKNEYQNLKKMLLVILTKEKKPIAMSFRHDFIQKAYQLGYAVDEIVDLSKRMDPTYLATNEWVSGVLMMRLGKKNKNKEDWATTLRMKSRDWDEQAAEFINAAYEIGVEPQDVQLQMSVLGYSFEISDLW